MVMSLRSSALPSAATRSSATHPCIWSIRRATSCSSTIRDPSCGCTRRASNPDKRTCSSPYLDVTCSPMLKPSRAIMALAYKTRTKTYKKNSRLTRAKSSLTGPDPDDNFIPVCYRNFRGHFSRFSQVQQKTE